MDDLPMMFFNCNYQDLLTHPLDILFVCMSIDIAPTVDGRFKEGYMFL